MRSALFLACFCSSLGACDAPDDVASHRAPNLFGPDDRMEWYATTDLSLQDLARRSTLAVIPTDRVDVTDPENVIIADRGTHTEVHDLCPGEAFGDQPVSARCSATLVAPNTVLSAGHCFDEADDCMDSAFVFDWLYDAPGSFPNLTIDDVYYCSSVAVVRSAGDRDYAVITLDRPVEGPRRPAPVRYAVTTLLYDDPVTVIGHGAGLPMKIDTGGRVVAYGPDFFETTADTFSGNSGSGVFLPDGTLVGIHVRGPDDYIDMGGCNVVNRLSDDSTRTSGGDASHIGHAIRELCLSNSSPLCGEPDTLCRGDCACPTDSICLTEGDAIYCSPRCRRSDDCQAGHECVTSRCRPGPGCFAGEVWTRDACGRPLRPLETCAPAEVCLTYACEPAALGDVCENTMEIAARTTALNVDLRTEYRDSTRGSCGGRGEDRVWTFELTEETEIRAHSRDDGWLVYLRSDCADPSSEIACAGQTGVALIEETLPAGRYFLFIDAAVLATRITILTVEFGPFDVPMEDAGTMMGTDAGTVMGTDAGPGEDGGGCDCSAASPTRSPVRAGLSALGVVAVLTIRRRRRRQR